MARDKNNQHHTYCWEFQESLVKYGNGNWFGRLIAYKGEVHISNNVFNQEQFHSLFENNTIQIIKIDTDFNSIYFTPDDLLNKDAYQSGTITSVVEVQMILNGVTINDRFTITHQVKPAFQSKLTIAK